MYGTYEAFRYKVPGLYKLRYVGQTTLSSAAVFACSSAPAACCTVAGGRGIERLCGERERESLVFVVCEEAESAVTREGSGESKEEKRRRRRLLSHSALAISFRCPVLFVQVRRRLLLSEPLRARCACPRTPHRG